MSDPADSQDRMAVRAVSDCGAKGVRLSRNELLLLLSTPHWTDVVEAGHRRRVALHGDSTSSYTFFRVINYTNFCDVGCTFCSFQNEVDSGRGTTLTLNQIESKVEEAVREGADAIFFQGGVHPGLSLSYHLDALRLIAHEHGLQVRGYSPIELRRMAEIYRLSLPDLLEQLREAGLSSVPGSGAEILTPRMREVLAPRKLSSTEWCEVMDACHRAGLPGSCNIVVGSSETQEDVADHLEVLRGQQDRSGGFLSFIAWTFQPQTKGFPIRHVPSHEMLRLIAAARLFLDNVPHVEVSVMVLGRELAELGLRAGADDISSVVIEENVLASRGLRTERAARRFLEEAGFRPVRRTLAWLPIPDTQHVSA